MRRVAKLSPEDEYRQLKGYGPEVEVPISLESHTLQPDEARNLEAARWAAEERRENRPSQKDRARPPEQLPRSWPKP